MAAAIEFELQRSASSSASSCSKQHFRGSIQAITTTASLAAFVKVMPEYPRTPVLLVTRDINLREKAEYAALASVELPDS